MSDGISSSIAGGNFWGGVKQGLITSGLNHVAHSMLEQYPMVEKPVEQMTEEEIIQANMNNLLEFNKNLLDGYMLLEGAKGIWGLKDLFINGGKKFWSSIAGLSGKSSSEVAVKYSNELVKSAQKLYPNKAGKIELHHITPKYLGGAKDGPLVPLDASYHQVITNEFRTLWPYGKGVPSATELQKIMKQVYSKYPLPSGY